MMVSYVKENNKILTEQTTAKEYLTIPGSVSKPTETGGEGDRNGSALFKRKGAGSQLLDLCDGASDSGGECLTFSVDVGLGVPGMSLSSVATS